MDVLPGHVIADAAVIASRVGVQRVTEWVALALNHLVDDHGYGTVADAMRREDGLRVRSPASAAELPPKPWL